MATQQPPTASGLERLVDSDRQIGYGLIGAGLALAAIPIANVSMHRGNSLAVLIWGACLSIFVVAVGVYANAPTTPDPDRQRRIERLRWVLMLTAGGVGAMTVLLGLILPFCSQPPMALTNYREIFTGGPGEWRKRENVQPILICLGAVLGGLVLMFIGLQLARPVQRTSMTMRRWLYGYNAVLSSLLLFFILVLVNLLPYTDVKPFAWAKESTDWTAEKLYTLDARTKNVLANLKEPVKVYLLMPEGNPITRQAETLMTNCRGVTSQLTWEELSPDQDPIAFEKLRVQYKLQERAGMLVVYGTPPNTTYQFTDAKDIFTPGIGGERGKGFEFKGENALLNSLTYLTSGKTRAAVYFTQGHGELDFNDQSAAQPDVGLGMLQEELTKINYTTHALKLGPKTTSVPEDADIVVVAGPREEFSTTAVTALRDFLTGANRKDKKKGKLIVLFDVAIRQGQMIRTGLEPLVAEYGIKVGDNRLMDASKRNPIQLSVIPDPRSTSPVARAFVTPGQPISPFVFYDTRSVESAGRPGGQYTVDNVIITHPNSPVWTETDLKADPFELTNQLLRKPEQLRAKINEEPVPVCLAVTEGKSAIPQIPGHEGLAKEGEPRLIVFGDASWVSNRIVRVSPDNFGLLSSSLAWLSGRQDIGEVVPASARNMYRLKLTADEGWRLVLLPGTLMLCLVIALGFGVWVVRRR